MGIGVQSSFFNHVNLFLVGYSSRWPAYTFLVSRGVHLGALIGYSIWLWAKSLEDTAILLTFKSSSVKTIGPSPLPELDLLVLSSFEVKTAGLSTSPFF